jgi:hypothetical protein
MEMLFASQIPLQQLGLCVICQLHQLQDLDKRQKLELLWVMFQSLLLLRTLISLFQVLLEFHLT